jgi:hypothetical protein
VLAALAACRSRGTTVTAEAIADAVCTAVIESGESFALHTDDATGVSISGEDARPVLGCRHVAAAIDPHHTHAYFPADGDAERDSAAAVARVLERWKQGDRIEMISLHGAPQNAEVLINTGTRFTVGPGPAGYFVYDETRDRHLMLEQLAPRLEYLGIAFDDLWSAAQHQIQATLHVAVPDFNRWRVDADVPEPIVESLGPIG